MIKVLFVCLGNICRSPMAEFLFKDMVKKKNLDNMFLISGVFKIDNYISYYHMINDACIEN